jgi:ABC-type branched-subunit amino acid transport system substrate-binding protein
LIVFVQVEQTLGLFIKLEIARSDTTYILFWLHPLWEIAALALEFYMSRPRGILIFLAALTIGIASAGGANVDGGSEIVLGMSTALSGPASNLGKDMQRGVLAGLRRANDAGGIRGRRLRLTALDDGYEPARAILNMRELLEQDRVLAVIGNVGTPTAVAAVPIANEDKTLFFAPFTGAAFLRKSPPNRYVINYRASYADEIGAMVDALVGPGGLKVEDIAFFTQCDSYGDAGYDGGIAALTRHGLKDESQIMHVRYERNTLAVENALANLVYAEHPPRAIIMVGAYAPCAKFIRLACQADVKSLFLNVSFVGSNSLAAELGSTPCDVIITQVVPHPSAHDLLIVQEYEVDLRRLDPTAQPGFGSLEGYVAARIFTRALEHIPGPPTRENIIDALEGLGRFDLGLGVPLEYGAGNHSASHQVWPTIIRDGKVVPFDWNDLASLLKKEAAPS